MTRWVAAAQCTLAVTAQWLLPLDIQQYDLESADAAIAEGMEALAALVLVACETGKEASMQRSFSMRQDSILYEFNVAQAGNALQAAGFLARLGERRQESESLCFFFCLIYDFLSVISESYLVHLYPVLLCLWAKWHFEAFLQLRLLSGPTRQSCSTIWPHL